MITSIGVEKESSIWAIRGQFVDMFGALNALFSGLAFAGIIFTIRQQKEELELQREELKMTREELAKSADAQQKSEVALNKQFIAYCKNSMERILKELGRQGY